MDESILNRCLHLASTLLFCWVWVDRAFATRGGEPCRSRKWSYASRPKPIFIESLDERSILLWYSYCQQLRWATNVGDNNEIDRSPHREPTMRAREERKRVGVSENTAGPSRTNKIQKET